MDKRFIDDKEFKNIYNRVPRFCVDLLVETEDGALLTKRNINPWKGYWHFPGGTVYAGETIKSAIKRVAREELNIDVDIIKPIGEMEFIRNDKRDGQRHIISLAFLVKADNLSKIKLNRQANGILFCKLAKSIPKRTIKQHSRLLLKYLK